MGSGFTRGARALLFAPKMAAAAAPHAPAYSSEQTEIEMSKVSLRAGCRVRMGALRAEDARILKPRCRSTSTTAAAFRLAQIAARARRFPAMKQIGSWSSITLRSSATALETSTAGCRSHWKSRKKGIEGARQGADVPVWPVRNCRVASTAADESGRCCRLRESGLDQSRMRRGVFVFREPTTSITQTRRGRSEFTK